MTKYIRPSKIGRIFPNMYIFGYKYLNIRIFINSDNSSGPYQLTLTKLVFLKTRWTHLYVAYKSTLIYMSKRKVTYVYCLMLACLMFKIHWISFKCSVWNNLLTINVIIHINSGSFLNSKLLSFISNHFRFEILFLVIMGKILYSFEMVWSLFCLVCDMK